MAPLKLLLLLLLLLLLFDGAIVPDDGDRVCAALELCSDLMESGVCDLIEWASVLWPNRFADGGVCAPPVIIDDELESSSLSLSNVLWTGDFSPRLPWTWRNFKEKKRNFSNCDHLSMIRIVYTKNRNPKFNAYLHMLSQRWWMRVRLITAIDAAIVWFVRCVHMRMLFAIRWIGESSVASFMFAFKWFFA